MTKATTEIDEDSSLEAMWRVYRASVCGGQTLAKNWTTVVHAFLNARFYDGSRGQFPSADPVFLGSAGGQNLKDPQSSNSYSYSDDNPIVKGDPSGKCIEDKCGLEAAATIGFVGGVSQRPFLVTHGLVEFGAWTARSAAEFLTLQIKLVRQHPVRTASMSLTWGIAPEQVVMDGSACP